MLTRFLLLGVLSTAAVFAAGCGDSGPKLYSVKGTVKVDGKPASDALVFLHRKARESLNEPTPYATCKADGSFTVATPSAGEGAQAGEYVVTVVWPDMSKAPDGNGARPDLLGGSYDKPTKSALAAVVEPKDNQLPEFALKAPARVAPPQPNPGGVKTDK